MKAQNEESVFRGTLVAGLKFCLSPFLRRLANVESESDKIRMVHCSNSVNPKILCNLILLFEQETVSGAILD